MRSQGKFSKKSLINFGETQSLLKTSIIAIDEQYNIEYVNEYAKEILHLEKRPRLTCSSVTKLFEHLNLPSFFKTDYKTPFIICSNNYFQKWQKIIIQVCDKKLLLLVGQFTPLNDYSYVPAKFSPIP